MSTKYTTDFLDEESTEKLDDYLSRHQIVGEEIFPYLGEDFLSTAEDFHYNPISKEAFVRRMPFYFYKCKTKNEKQYQKLQSFINGIYEMYKFTSDVDYWEIAEKLYQALERIHYDFHVSVDSIFSYPFAQMKVNECTSMLFMWDEYLQMAKKLGVIDPMPEKFISAYNSCCESMGKQPKIFEISDQYIGEYISRCDGMVFRMEGTFPCDQSGNLVLRWVGVRIKNANKIWANIDQHCKGYLYVEANPKTAIWGLNCWGKNDDGSDRWYELYIGPQLMEFDFGALQKLRKRAKLTQQQVADAVGSSVRTYQKWESGETNPDSRYLLRLMNVLDIKSTSELTQAVLK